MKIRHLWCVMSALLKQPVDKKVVLGKAVLNAAEQLGLKQVQLAAILGVHRTAISKLKSHPDLDPNSKQGELALLLIRLVRALYALTGGDADWIKHFMNTTNRVTGGVPVKQIESISGLVTVLQFVDAIRGKL